MFYKEILGKLEDAKLIAYEAFELALKDYENTSPENMNECSTLMQLLSDNICLWNLEEKERKEFLK